MKRNIGSFSTANVLPTLFAPASRAATFSCLRGFGTGLLVIVALQSMWAQAAAPAALLVPGQPAFQAGAVATFTGRNFAPGESVTFQVTHVRGTPVTGTNHTPAQVVADAGGAFTATWLVCGNDCVGELLQVEATGRSSSRVGRAVFQDLPAAPARPATWVRTDKTDYAPGATANIAGSGFQAGETVVLQVHHADGTPDSGEDHAPWSVVANATGGCQSTWHVCEDDCLGSTLKLTALGQTSGKTAQAIFTDAGGAPTFEQLKSFGSPSPGGYPSALLKGTDGAFYGTAFSGGAKGFGTVFKINPDGSGFTVLKNFDYDTTGANPYSLLQGTDGALYGAATGGSLGYGTVFKLNTDGSGFTVLKHFDYAVSGASPTSLLLGADGKLYGTASRGGSVGYGAVFKLNTDGTGFTVLQAFDNWSTGGNPFGRLLWGADGKLYGTATQGGSGGYGTIFKLDTDGSGFTVLQNCSWSTTGANPYAGLIQGADGALYGGCEYGGPTGSYGTVFKLNPDGTGFTVIANFDYYTTGAYPVTELLQGTDGQLYGGAYVGGSDGYGGIFKLNPDGTGFTVLKSFADTMSFPSARLVQGTDGALYGASTYVYGTYGSLFRLSTDGTDFTVLKSFSSYPDVTIGGGYPQAGLVQAVDGKLYGTTSSGGGAGSGTVFKMNPDGTGFSVLKDLDYSTTGGYTFSGLIQGADGALYGTATDGGGGGGFGTVFKLNPDGSSFTVLKVFDWSTTGGYPYGELLQGTDGALYGTTAYGGSGFAGTVFKLNPDGTGFTVLKNLDWSTGGAPYAGLAQSPDGVLYGTTTGGGASGSGVVFKLNPDGTGFTVLKEFDNSTIGGYPYSPLVLGMDGALYGTTTAGGSGYVGTVFKLNPDGSGFVVLQNFDQSTTGGYLYAGLLQGADGLLYGATAYGGSGNYGTLFRLNPDGTGFAVLQNMDLTAGASPYGGLLLGTDGNIYGTTFQGGDANAGTVFRLVFPSGNTPPIAKCKNVTVLAGAGCAANASIDDGSYDPDTGDTITLTQTPPGPYPLGQTTVTLTVTDSHGASSPCTAVVTVSNPDPVVTLTGPVSGVLFAVNEPVNFTATFTDANGGTHTGAWMFDTISQPATIVEPAGATPGSATATHSFAAAGVYTVKLTVNDNCGGSGTATQIGSLDVLVIVYDPSAGFVTGGGWILSPPGAYAPDPTLTGKANFGFVSKYQKGQTIPKGETEFQLHCASFDFKSTSYQWLVVSGPKAQFKGFGQINGAGNYGFLLTATDGQVTGGGGVDKFRIKVWDQATSVVIYDNAMGSAEDIDHANPQAIGAGSIVIQK